MREVMCRCLRFRDDLEDEEREERACKASENVSSCDASGVKLTLCRFGHESIARAREEGKLGVDSVLGGAGRVLR